MLSNPSVCYVIAVRVGMLSPLLVPSHGCDCSENNVSRIRSEVSRWHVETLARYTLHVSSAVRPLSSVVPFSSLGGAQPLMVTALKMDDGRRTMDDERPHIVLRPSPVVSGHIPKKPKNARKKELC